MHDGMQYDPIQGEDYESLKSGHFQSYLLHHLQWQLAIDYGFLNYGTMSKLVQARFFCIWPSFCVTWLWSW